MKKKNYTVLFVITVKINLQKILQNILLPARQGETDHNHRRTDRDHQRIHSHEDAGEVRTSGQENFSGNPY